MDINRHDKTPTFGEIWPNAEFSELIRLSLMIAAAVLRAWVRFQLRQAVRTPPIVP